MLLFKSLRYCPFIVTFNKYNGSCDTPDDRSNRICVPNETEDVACL